MEPECAQPDRHAVQNSSAAVAAPSDPIALQLRRLPCLCLLPTTGLPTLSMRAWHAGSSTRCVKHGCLLDACCQHSASSHRPADQQSAPSLNSAPHRLRALSIPLIAQNCCAARLGRSLHHQRAPGRCGVWQPAELRRRAAVQPHRPPALFPVSDGCHHAGRQGCSGLLCGRWPAGGLCYAVFLAPAIC